MKLLFTGLMLLFMAVAATAQLRLPKLVSNGMVLQRNTALTIWGWAAPGEKVQLHFTAIRQPVRPVITGSNGIWKFTLPASKAGGPYTMAIKANQSVITINDIVIGDVWLCSGQSNMELDMNRVKPLYAQVLEHADDNLIRQFTVTDDYRFTAPAEDVTGGEWIKADKKEIGRFSAVAYFFAKNLYDTYKIPQGLINAAVGGSPIEAWLSEKELQQFPDAYKELQLYKEEAYVKQVEKNDSEKQSAWYQSVNNGDKGAGQWQLPDTDTRDWKTMNIPGYWADTDAGNFNGIAWFTKKFELPAKFRDKPVTLLLGNIVDADSVFMNGKLVGTTSYQYPPRRYTVPAAVLQNGTNTITVKVTNTTGKGGFVPGKLYALTTPTDTVFLQDIWKYEVGVKAQPLPAPVFIRWKPAGLYNAMVAPLTSYAIKGILWYQGESNTGYPDHYGKALQALITSWRMAWHKNDLPFLYVQLPNFLAPVTTPQETGIAVLRQHQLNTLALPNTGMAVTIDVGEWNDIHPLQKKPVGDRLALQAKRLVYGDKKIIHSGPLPLSAKWNGKNIRVSFTHTGSGLVSRASTIVNEVTVAGSDKKFEWAGAYIQNNQLMVTTTIQQPMYIRYAWANNPDKANLYNKEGLPASPFELTIQYENVKDKDITKGLKAYYKSYFDIGVAVNAKVLQTDEAVLIRQQFNSMTAENAMKLAVLQPRQGVFNWREADSIAAFAKRHGLKLRGHTLCWHQQVPDWFFYDADKKLVTKEELLRRLKTHITAVVTRYKDVVYAWDVVNEVISDNAGEVYRNSLWYQIGGEDFISKAFEYAHEADKNALLFYNDYNEIDAAKRAKIIALVKGLRQKGIPVHGVGLQSHWAITEPALQQLEATLKDFSQLGLPLHITELDVSVYKKEHTARQRLATDTDTIYTKEKEAAQTAAYKMYFRLFRKYSKYISSVTFWNISDRHSWLDYFPVENRKDYPLLFDKNLQPKPAYWEVVNFK
jgi:sialate O-acetylesterase